ncbi:MAG: hypothetical protein KJ687_11700 [Proteobacteria bacterium]|nr:hypothetical protein [Pseudomonadota bacterium]
MEFGQDKTATVKLVAAWYLANQAVINQCVIESLLSGIESCNVEISNEFNKLLGTITNIHKSFTKKQWQEWWRENKTNYDPCTQ